MRVLTVVMLPLSLLLSAAIFGFFYAWVCSTMWGLDNADPRVAIQAMQAMNASVRNAVFAPAFFATPVILALVAWSMWQHANKTSGLLFAAASLLYLTCGLFLTLSVNVPMNEALSELIVPTDIDAASVIWQDYSKPWQFWNQTRTVASGLSFLLAVAGTLTFTNRRM